MDDAAVLDIGGVSLALTHDMIVEGVHFLAHDPAEEVAWKLLAVNLSDLAAKGARPIGVLLGYALTPLVQVFIALAVGWPLLLLGQLLS